VDLQWQRDLDVATLCPGYPHTIIPGSMCGHSGPTGAGFAVVKATADGIDPVDKQRFIKTQRASPRSCRGR